MAKVGSHARRKVSTYKRWCSGGVLAFITFFFLAGSSGRNGRDRTIEAVNSATSPNGYSAFRVASSSFNGFWGNAFLAPQVQLRGGSCISIDIGATSSGII